MSHNWDDNSYFDSDSESMNQEAIEKDLLEDLVVEMAKRKHKIDICIEKCKWNIRDLIDLVFLISELPDHGKDHGADVIGKTVADKNSRR